MKNKAKLSTLLLALTSVVLTGCDNVSEPDVDNRDGEITNITLDKRYASLFYNDGSDAFHEEITLSPVVYPRKNCERKIKWSSSNESVATVDKNGKVTAVGEGFSDITVSNEDGTISASTHIVVNNMKEQKISYCNTRQDDIFATQKSASFKIPDVVTSYETFTQTVEKNGVQISKTYFTQNIKTSKENAYIELDIDQLEWRCEGASPVPTKMKYVFYTTNQYETYLFKTSGITQNYFSVNQSEFIGQNRINALKAICDNFFKSGDKIFDDNYANILMQNTTGFITSPAENKHYGRMQNVAGQLAFDVTATYNEVATSEDEKDIYIPAGTKYVFDIYDRFLYEDYFCTGKYVEQKATYKIGDDTYVNTVIVDTYFKANEEINYPNKDNFAKVDGIFGL